MTNIFSVDLPIRPVVNLTRRLRKLSESGDTFCQRVNLFIVATLFTLSFFSYSIHVFLAKDNKGVSVYCYCPADFSSSRVHYTNYVCNTQGFYYVPYVEPLPDIMSRHGLDGKEHTLKYYPWISLILILQAFLFYIPHLLWRLGAVREGFHHAVCLDIIDRHMFERKTDESGRKIKEEVIDSIENYLIRLIGLQDSASSYLTPLIPMGYRYTAWFVAAHFFLIINSVSQFYLLEFLLGIDFMNFGIDYLSQMPNLLWKDPNRFPRTAFCDLTIRQQTNIQLYTVQCALPSNMFTEKMFMFVWIILLGVSILNILSFAYHVTTIQRLRFKTIEKINSYQLMKNTNIRSGMNVNKFVCRFLKLDILWFIWLLNRSHKHITDDVICRLWDRYSCEINRDAHDEDE